MQALRSPPHARADRRVAAWTGAQVGAGLMANRRGRGRAGWPSDCWGPSVSETLTLPLTAPHPLRSLRLLP